MLGQQGLRLQNGLSLLSWLLVSLMFSAYPNLVALFKQVPRAFKHILALCLSEC